MSDLISRQAAIDALAKQMPRSYTSDGSHPADEEIFKAQEVYADCIETIELLPSVQPDHVADVSKKAEAEDCISRQAAIYAAREELESGTYFDIPSKIEALPAVQPEPHWIPCRKKLPEKAGAYLAQALMNGDIFVARWEGCYWGVKTPIIAWQPLPEPYRGGEKE